MTKCPACLKEIPAERNSCPSCGTTLGESFTPTQLLPDSASHKDNTRVRKASSSRSSSSFDSIDDARFTPGTTLIERYRIVSLLGRGGMGEVYRADDLKLGQPVALKFLPEMISSDGAALARFHREVRVARQVSHRNVCRVYDIGEVGGQHFLSMEFISGEELASLIRRIGRLPPDKAIEIARQICAGLAAAHDNNVLHRDLKPANVMIDADGNARITDFGLAGLAEEIRSEEVRAGTPAYMAPEQLSGEEVSVKSDIYSLGLVLYELFTGKRAFEAKSLDDLIRLRKSTATPTTPSSFVKEIDPVVERVILRCLEKNPKNRPASALQVAAALPGGDPLQAALAAGETPSPEMVAAAPTEGALRPSIALALLVSVLGMFAVVSFLAKPIALWNLVPLEKSPEVLKERARDVARRLGYTERPVDSEYGIYQDRDYFQYVLNNDPSRSRWDKLPTGQPAAFYFWYRQSPRDLATAGFGPVSIIDPPEEVSGMVTVVLDTQGQLRRFTAVPPQREEPQRTENAPQPDWSPLFTEAGFDPANFQKVESTWIPLHANDKREAWDGVYPLNPQARIHVEAAAYRGKPVYFEVINPWDRPVRQQENEESTSDKLIPIIIGMVFVLVLVGSVLLAVRNLRLGRGDRKGAFRLALFFFTARILLWIFEAHHIWSVDELLIFIEYLKAALFPACFLWLIYIALEPYVRRRWPQGIISWSRLLAGGFRDPLVGRDILIGALCGVLLIANNYLADLAPKLLGLSPNKPFIDGQKLLGMRSFIPDLNRLLTSTLFLSLSFLFILVFLFIILRRRWLAALAGWIFYACLLSLAVSDRSPVSLLFGAVTGSLITVGVLYRYGLLTMISMMFFFHAWVFLPITTDLSAWYAGDFVLALAMYIALAFYSFYISLAGQPLFRGKLLED